MRTASSELQDLARRLLSLESTLGASSSERDAAAFRVIQELRLRLIKLAGIHGFRSLLLRALTLAKVQAPSLNSVQVRADGSLEGLEEIDRGEDGGASGFAGIQLVAHLLELLVTFIGARLTLQLLRDKWPDASIDEAALRSEDKP